MLKDKNEKDKELNLNLMLSGTRRTLVFHLTWRGEMSSPTLNNVKLVSKFMETFQNVGWWIENFF
jgi:hypothetical protein